VKKEIKDKNINPLDHVSPNDAGLSGSGEGVLSSKKKPVSKPFDRSKEEASINLSPYLIQSFKYKDRKSFAFYLKLKQSFTNSRIYNYSAMSLSKKIGVSYYNTKKHIDFLLDNNYAYFEGADLMLVSINKISKFRRFRKWAILIKKDDDLNEILNSMNILLLKHSLEKQEYVRTAKRNDQAACGVRNKTKMTLSLYKKIKKIRRYQPELIHGSLRDYNIVGVRKLSEILGCSIDTAAKFLLKLERSKVIKRQVIKGVIRKGNDTTGFSNISYKEVFGESYGYIYQVGNCILFILGTSIQFT